jgi:hypothetical protein
VWPPNHWQPPPCCSCPCTDQQKLSVNTRLLFCTGPPESEKARTGPPDPPTRASCRGKRFCTGKSAGPGQDWTIVWARECGQHSRAVPETRERDNTGWVLGLNGVANFIEKGMCSWILVHKNLISFCLYSSQRLMASPLFRIQMTRTWRSGRPVPIKLSV